MNTHYNQIDSNIQIIFCQPSHLGFYHYYVNSLNKRNSISKQDLIAFLYKISPSLYRDFKYFIDRFKEFYIIPSKNSIEEVTPDKENYIKAKKQILDNNLKETIHGGEEKSMDEKLKSSSKNLINRLFKQKN